MNLLDKNFKAQFWDWFDELPKIEKDKFLYYNSDMAELFFYNKYYSKGIDPFNDQVAQRNRAFGYEPKG
jgi:hypothetical protein